MDSPEIRRKLNPSDEASIRDLLHRMNDAWAKGDGSAYASVFADDAVYVTAPGERVIGRKSIALAHQMIFDSLFRKTHLGSSYPIEFQVVSPEVVLVHTAGSVLFAGESEADVQPNGLITLVAENGSGGWRFVSFNNTQTGKGRNAIFFWRFVKSRTWWPFLAEWSKAKEHILQEKQENIAKWKRK